MANQVEQELMRKLVIGMQNNRGNLHGFTLIEILVVVLIIGITIGFALLAFGDFGSNRRILMSAEQFVNYVKFVQHQSILETSTLGIRLNQNSYQVLRFEAPSNWQVMPKNSIFHQQQFPDSAIVYFENTTDKNGNPQIIINSSGDMTAFKLTVGSSKQAIITRIIGESNGAITLQFLKSP